MSKYLGLSMQDLREQRKFLKRFKKGVKKGLKKLNNELATVSQDKKEINKIIKNKKAKK